MSADPQIVGDALMVTGWRSKEDPNGVGPTEVSRAELLTWIRHPATATEKLSLPGFSLATFAGNHRAAKDTVAVYAVVLDDDTGLRDVEATAKVWSKFSGITFSTFSSTPEAPRTRTILFTTRPMTAHEYGIVWRHVRDLALENGVELDESTKDPSRLWFIPAVRPDANYLCRDLDGLPLDVDAVLAAAPTMPPSPASRVRVTSAGAPVAAASHSLPRRRQVAAATLGNAWPAKGRHHAQLALAGALRRDGWSKEEALEFLCTVCRIAGDEDRVKRVNTIEHTWSTDQNVTGWSTLEKHVDPIVVSSVRDMLDDGADLRVALTAMMARATGKPRSVGDSDERAHVDAGGLGFEYGAWDAEPPPVEFLVDSLIPRSAVGLVFGRADAMKTWLLYSQAIALAKGEPWLGRFTTKRARVGVVDYETGRGNTRRRLYMLRAGQNSNLGAVSFTALKPNEREFWIELARERFDIVVIDSLRRANPGANENDSAEAIRPLELAAEFAETTGCAVLFIHHATKASNDGWPEFRGSGAIEDQVDFAYAVRKVDISETRKRVELRCTKPGDMRTPEPFAVEVVFDDEKRLVTMEHTPVAPNVNKQGSLRAEDMDARIRLAIEPGELSGYRAVATATGLPQKVVRERLAILIERGDVVRGREGSKERLYPGDEPSQRARIRRTLGEATRGRAVRTKDELAKRAGVRKAAVDVAFDDGEIGWSSAGAGDEGTRIVVSKRCAS